MTTLPIPRYYRTHLRQRAILLLASRAIRAPGAGKLSASNVSLISVVDDDPSVVEGIVSLLESVGYTAAGFAAAQDFLNSPKLRRTACLILDVHMPGMGGIELQRRLAAENFRRPIIFITAHGGPVVSEELLGGGSGIFLRKPFSQESLLKALGSALGFPEGSTGGQSLNP